MQLPSQTKAQGLFEILKYISEKGKFPSRNTKLTGNAQYWGARKTLAYLKDFVETDCPEFYHNKNKKELEQNNLIAEESLQTMLYETECLEDGLNLLKSYAQEIKEPKIIRNLSNLNHIPTVLNNSLDINANQSFPPSTLWIWENLSLLFIPFEVAFSNTTKKISKLIEKAEDLNPHCTINAIVIHKLKPTKGELITCTISEDHWTHLPDSQALSSPSWLLNHGMISEEVIDILEEIREISQNKTSPTINISPSI